MCERVCMHVSGCFLSNGLATLSVCMHAFEHLPRPFSNSHPVNVLASWLLFFSHSEIPTPSDFDFDCLNIFLLFHTGVCLCSVSFPKKWPIAETFPHECKANQSIVTRFSMYALYFVSHVYHERKCQSHSVHAMKLISVEHIDDTGYFSVYHTDWPSRWIVVNWNRSNKSSALTTHIDTMREHVQIIRTSYSIKLKRSWAQPDGIVSGGGNAEFNLSLCQCKAINNRNKPISTSRAEIDGVLLMLLNYAVIWYGSNDAYDTSAFSIFIVQYNLHQVAIIFTTNVERELNILCTCLLLRWSLHKL